MSEPSLDAAGMGVATASLGCNEPANEMDNVAMVLPASGTGERAHSSVPKQFMEVCGRPLICHTIESFHRMSFVTCIVVTVQEQWRRTLEQSVKQFNFHKVSVVLGDCRSRHYSILNGVAALRAQHLLSAGVRLVVLHDAVRPFASEAVLSEVVAKAAKYGAAGVVVPCTSTVLVTSDDAFMQHALVRSKCKSSEMPQAFQLSKLLDAYRKADDDVMMHGTECLDIYQQGNLDDKIALVTGSPELHWKVTYPRDFERAEKQLRATAAVAHATAPAVDHHDNDDR